jgi:glycosyltransferase involved in cell wall biosynthesis
VAGQSSAGSDFRPIRVLCLIKGLGRGGAEFLVAAQIRERDQKRFAYEVAYLAPQKKALVADLEAEGVPVTCLGAATSSNVTWLPRLRRLVLEREIDVVHVHSPVAAAGARLALRTIPAHKRPRIVTTEHNLWQSHVRMTRLADSLTAGRDDARVAVSSAVRASLPHRLRHRTEVIRHGIDVDAVVAQRAEREAVRRELGIEGRVVVGTVANLRLTKGWPDLLAAAKQVLEQVEEACFVAVGQGPMEEELRQLHQELGLGDGFQMLGFRPDAVRIMAGCDVFCLASHHEGLPIAVMEAMAIGLPIVATDVGGVRELVSDGLHGRLVPPHRPDLLAAALIEMVTNEQRRADAAAAVQSKATALSAEKSIRRVEAIYEELALP